MCIGGRCDSGKFLWMFSAIGAVRLVVIRAWITFRCGGAGPSRGRVLPCSTGVAGASSNPLDSLSCLWRRCSAGRRHADYGFRRRRNRSERHRSDVPCRMSSHRRTSTPVRDTRLIASAAGERNSTGASPSRQWASWLTAAAKSHGARSARGTIPRRSSGCPAAPSRALVMSRYRRVITR